MINISKINTKQQVSETKKQETKDKAVRENQQNMREISSSTSSACLSYGFSHVKKNSPVKAAAPVTQNENVNNTTKTLNLFYFSDTHGELSGLAKLGAAKEACEQYTDGKLTVLGAGDLIAGSQKPVINATVGVVNKLGMEATSLGNHERSRSDAELTELAENLNPELLAVNASQNDKKCSVVASKVCRQGDIDFITVGAQPLSDIENPADIAKAIDDEVLRIREERKSQGLDENIPVIFLSHMGSGADKVVAENSSTVDVILGGHSHHVEEYNYTNASGNNVYVLQGGKNNQYATVVKLDIQDDGKVAASSSKKIDLKTDTNNICEQVKGFYGTEGLEEKALESAEETAKEINQTIEEQVGPKKDIAYVPEGQGYHLYDDGYERGAERNYSNPVSNIMADAMIQATKDRGVELSFGQAATVKDTAIDDKAAISNYDLISRILPFGGEVVTTELPAEKLYEVIEKLAQTVVNGDGSMLMQVGGMVYSVDAEKARARYNANIEVLKAEDNLKKATEENKTQAEKELAEAKEKYEQTPPCVNKILILKDDGTEIKINPKALKRGDYKGLTFKCATDYFYAHQIGLDKNPEYKTERTGLPLAEVFEQGLQQVCAENDGVINVDQNDVRISINDKNGIVNGYKVSKGVNTKYWY